jgi:[acyl-carrier-protein] S-malonyltransferase
MRPAADALAHALHGVELSRARVPVVVNTTAEPTQDPKALCEELAVQVYSPVRWIETLRTLAHMGCDRFLEVGPGNVLTGLVKRTLPDAKVANFGSLTDLDGVRAL